MAVIAREAVHQRPQQGTRIVPERSLWNKSLWGAPGRAENANAIPDLAVEAAFEAVLRLLSTPLVGDDPATKAMEAVQQAMIAAHLRLQKEKEDVIV